MDTDKFSQGLLDLAQALLPVFLKSVCVFVGLFFIAIAIYTLTQVDERKRQGKGSAGPITGGLAVGSLIIQMANTVKQFVDGLFGAGISDPRDAMQYMPEQVQGNAHWALILQACFTWLFLLGWFAIFRGLIQWRKLSIEGAAGGKDLGWAGLWHIIGGIILVNIGGLFSG